MDDTLKRKDRLGEVPRKSRKKKKSRYRQGQGKDILVREEKNSHSLIKNTEENPNKKT